MSFIESERETMEPEREKEKVDKESPQEEYNLNNIVREMLIIEDEYRPLLTLLENFSLREETMDYYKKMRLFENSVHYMCPSDTQLNDAEEFFEARFRAFATFRAAALLNSRTALKLAAVGASFTREPREHRLRAALMNVVMQGTFSKLDALKQSDLMLLINAASLVGDYFAFAQVFRVNNLEVLAFPLLQYIRALLGIKDIRARRCLNLQLWKNGDVLHLLLPQELAELKSLIGRDAVRG